jgi:hypothetical protein
MLAFGIMVLSVMGNDVRPPVVIEKAHILTPNVCGTLIRYHTRVSFRDTPSMLQVVRVVWDDEADNTIVYATAQRYFLLQKDTTIERDMEYELSERLPPGPYTLLVGWQAEGTKPAIAAMPFIVPEVCP